MNLRDTGKPPKPLIFQPRIFNMFIHSKLKKQPFLHHALMCHFELKTEPLLLNYSQNFEKMVFWTCHLSPNFDKIIVAITYLLHYALMSNKIYQISTRNIAILLKFGERRSVQVSPFIPENDIFVRARW